jgi:hypothetical protein
VADASDLLLAADGGAEHVTAREGRIAWSSGVAGAHRLVTLTSAGVESLPLPGSPRPFFPHLGRRGDGSPVVTYVRCSGRTCRPRMWDFQRREPRHVRVNVRRGCRLTEAAVWRDLVVLLYSDHDLPAARTRRCRVKRGSQPARRVSRNAYRLGDLTGRRVSWFEDFAGGDVWRLRAAVIPRAPHTIMLGSIDGGSLRGGSIRGEHVFYATNVGDGRWTLNRGSTAQSGSGGVCWPPGGEQQEPFEEFSFPEGNDGPDFAVDGDRVLYASRSGVFQFQREPWVC